MSDEDVDAVKAVWSRFCDDLKSAGERLFRPTTPEDMLTAAEGLRHLTRLTRIGLESSVEFADPLFPAIARMVDETRKFGCDNPDTIYQRAVVDGRYAYRITGRRGTVDYLSFTATKGLPSQVVQTGFLDSKMLEVDGDCNFAITLSQDKTQGNWLRIEPETRSINIRQTFLDRRTERPADLHIERVGGTGAPAELTLEHIGAQLGAASGFVGYCATLFTGWTESYQLHPNTLPPADQAATQRAGGDPNIYFYRSFWTLKPDEALVVFIPRIPECDTWNLQVDNYWQESMDYRYHRSHVNKHTAKYNPDGSVTIVIAHRDPGHSNWLDTAGHNSGHFAMRYIRAREHVDPMTKLCKFEDVMAEISSFESGSR